MATDSSPSSSPDAQPRKRGRKAVLFLALVLMLVGGGVWLGHVWFSGPAANTAATTTTATSSAASRPTSLAPSTGASLTSATASTSTAAATTTTTSSAAVSDGISSLDETRPGFARAVSNPCTGNTTNVVLQITWTQDNGRINPTPHATAYGLAEGSRTSLGIQDAIKVVSSDANALFWTLGRAQFTGAVVQDWNPASQPVWFRSLPTELDYAQPGSPPASIYICGHS